MAFFLCSCVIIFQSFYYLILQLFGLNFMKMQQNIKFPKCKQICIMIFLWMSPLQPFAKQNKLGYAWETSPVHSIEWRWRWCFKYFFSFSLDFSKTPFQLTTILRQSYDLVIYLMFLVSKSLEAKNQVMCQWRWVPWHF